MLNDVLNYFGEHDKLIIASARIFIILLAFSKIRQNLYHFKLLLKAP